MRGYAKSVVGPGHLAARLMRFAYRVNEFDFVMRSLNQSLALALLMMEAKRVSSFKKSGC